MKYIQIDNDNRILGAYDSNYNKLIPDDAIKVTEKIFKERLNDSSLNAYNSETKTLRKEDFRTEEEINEQEKTDKKNKAQAYLDDTDFYMTVDKYAQLTEEKRIELETLREEAREVIRRYEEE